MLVADFKAALAKSTGPQTLYDHSMACVDAALRVAKLAGEPAGPRLDVLLLATFLHDVGKLDPAFQAMLEAAVARQPLPSSRVKHEARTLQYGPERFEASREEISREIRGALGCNVNGASVGPRQIEDVWAFAVTHHGLFHVSHERDLHGDAKVVARRQWTAFYPTEQRRVTLVDLLVDYHPLGGLVMISDLVASYCHERGRRHEWLFSNVHNVGQLIDRLAADAQEIEAGICRYDPRRYGLADMLRLLARGIT